MRESLRAVGAATGAVAVFVGGTTVVAYRDGSAKMVWHVALAMGFFALWLISWGTKGRLFENERGRWSLSRFQFLLWTWLILSTFWTLVLLRLMSSADPLDLQIDDNLYWLLGVSGASFVASPLILARKAQAGTLETRPAGSGGPQDLFTGEDDDTSDQVDLGRVQMWFFTIVSLIAYTAAIAHEIGSSAAAHLTFPKMSDGLVTLLGISHATYLGNKLPDRTVSPAAPPPAPPALTASPSAAAPPEAAIPAGAAAVPLQAAAPPGLGQ